MIPDHYYVEDSVDGTLKANGAGGFPRTDRQPLVVADTLTSGLHPASNMPGRRREDDTNLGGSGGAKLAIAFHLNPDDKQAGPGALKAVESDIAPPLTATENESTTDRGLRIANSSGVRRLTPVECERLQGFPDDWTRVDGEKTPDSRRYAAMGDAVTVPVIRWLGTRLHMLEVVA